MYADEGKTKAAEQLVRQSLEEIRRRNPGNKALLGQSELALGTVMIAAGEQKQAIGVLGEAANTIEAADGPHSPVLARARNNHRPVDLKDALLAERRRLRR